MIVIHLKVVLFPVGLSCRPMLRVCGAAFALCYVSLLAIGLERVGYWWAASPGASADAGLVHSAETTVEAMAAGPRPSSKIVALLSDGGPAVVEVLAMGHVTAMAQSQSGQAQVSGGRSSIWRYGQSGGPRAP